MSIFMNKGSIFSFLKISMISMSKVDALFIFFIFYIFYFLFLFIFIYFLLFRFIFYYFFIFYFLFLPFFLKPGHGTRFKYPLKFPLLSFLLFRKGTKQNSFWLLRGSNKGEEMIESFLLKEGS